MRDFYERYYDTVQRSRAHALFCKRVFGRNLCQHGFADMAQIEAVLALTNLGPANCALDLGCGNGMIAEYLSDRTGAHITGLDYVPGAIHQAQQRTAAKAYRLQFVGGDINALDLPPQAFETILSIDTIYFSDDYGATIGRLKAALQPGGQMAFLYTHGWEPWTPVESFDKATLAPDATPLARALHAHGLPYETRDFTADDLHLARQRQEVLVELKPQFAAEDIMFIWENRMGDAQGIARAVEMGLQRRYLYHARLIKN
jgi:ubiquinone/menaquinone biosynthesis C-methylase UbiE